MLSVYLESDYRISKPVFFVVLTENKQRRFSILDLSMKVAILTLAIVETATPVFAVPCKVAHSVYRNVDGKGFELFFGSSIPGTGISYATATINHPNQKQIYSFSVTQSNGYGSIFFLIINPTNNGLEYGENFVINFFDQNLRSDTPGVLGREVQAPKYFITGLGSYDYYKRRSKRSTDTPPFLGDSMWVYDRCQ
jgi:hypothetical protein